MPEATGRPFDSSLARAEPGGSEPGAALAGAFASLDNAGLIDTGFSGDTVTTLVLGLAAAPPCAGDCDQNGLVTVAELVTGVNLALRSVSPDECSAIDTNGNHQVTVDEVIAAVGAALSECGA